MTQHIFPSQDVRSVSLLLQILVRLPRRSAVTDGTFSGGLGKAQETGRIHPLKQRTLGRILLNVVLMLNVIVMVVERNFTEMFFSFGLDCESLADRPYRSLGI
jgi:hypothetical protein